MTRETTTGPTPGPWTPVPARTEHGDYYHRITADREVDGACIATTVTVPNGDREAMESDAADARLIAAAPDLLAALREVADAHEALLREYGKPWGWGRLPVETARSAIARAEGRIA